MVQVGKTQLRYHLSCIEDLRADVDGRGDWVALGNADEQKRATDGTVEAWGRSPDNPIGGWYGFKKGLRGRFGNYVPPVLEALGKAEVEHNPRNNRMPRSEPRRPSGADRQPHRRQLEGAQGQRHPAAGRLEQLAPLLEGSRPAPARVMGAPRSSVTAARSPTASSRADHEITEP